MTSGHDSPEGPAFHRDGSLFFVNWLSSSILRLSPAAPGGTVTEFANIGGIPAGLAFHPDGTLYVADEGDQWHGILRVSPSGEITPWITEYRGTVPPGAAGDSDGMAFDEAGYLYVAHYNFGRVDVFGPTGRERDRIMLPGAGVTNVAFGGRGGRDLVITAVTTASVYRTRVDLPGLPLFAATGGPS